MANAPTITIIIADLIAGWPESREGLLRRGMACVGCAMARFETVEEAAVAYGFDPHELLHDVAAASTSSNKRRHSS